MIRPASLPAAKVSPYLGFIGIDTYDSACQSSRSKSVDPDKSKIGRAVYFGIDQDGRNVFLITFLEQIDSLFLKIRSQDQSVGPGCQYGLEHRLEMVFVVLVIKEDVFFYIEWIIIFKSFQYTLSYFFPVKILVGIGEESEDSGRGTTGERTGDDIGAVL